MILMQSLLVSSIVNLYFWIFLISVLQSLKLHVLKLDRDVDELQHKLVGFATYLSS